MTMTSGNSTSSFCRVGTLSTYLSERSSWRDSIESANSNENAGNLLRPRKSDECDRDERVHRIVDAHRRTAAAAERNRLHFRALVFAGNARDCDGVAAHDSRFRRLPA